MTILLTFCFDPNILSEMNLRQMEKVDLHRHLEGSVRRSTLLELAPLVGIEVPRAVEAQDEKFLVKTPLRDLATVLNKFWMTQAVLTSEEIIARITFEAIEDAYNDGIRILELRYSPTFIQKNHENLSFEQIHSAVLRGVKMAEKWPLAVGLLCTIQRTLPLSVAEEVSAFALENAESFIGIDLADDEDAHPAKGFQNVFEKVLAAEFPVTIHAGESNSSLAPQNVMDAIEYLGARRIGHGVQVIKSPQAVDLVQRRRIHLEICVTSNWLTNDVQGLYAHPIRQLINAGVLVTVNSDDPGIFGIDLTNEYHLLSAHYQFSKADFDRCNDIAAQASFISLMKKQKHWPRPIHSIS
jgi:adenosine deaminase